MIKDIIRFVRSIRTHGPLCKETADNLVAKVLEVEPGDARFSAVASELTSYVNRCGHLQKDPDISAVAGALTITVNRHEDTLVAA